ncbi:MAG: AMP-binding protein [Actinomycetota bacterium]
MDGAFFADVDGLRVIRDLNPFPVGPSTIEQMWARRDPDSPAIIDGDRVITTGALRERCDAVTRALTALEAPDQPVAWKLDDDLAAVVAFLATIQAGAIWVGLNPRATDAERAHIVDDARARLVLDALPADRPATVPGPPPEPGRAGALAYTSGTTGRPKAAEHIHQQLLYPAAAAIATEGLDASARIGTPLPLSTLNIMLLGPLTALACGGAAVLMSRTDAHGFAAEVDRHGVTRALVVPTIVHDLVAAEIDPGSLRTLERLIMGGSGIARERADHARRMLGVPLVASYGLSEAPSGVARMEIGAAGAMPLPGIDLAVDPDGEITLAPETDGPWAHTWQGTRGYRGRPEATAALWRGGRLHTGDAGTLDDDGLLLVTGRVSDMINRGGATIAPAEVERTLLQLDGVRDAAVFGVDDARLGQIVAAAVVGPVEPDDLTVEVRARLSGYKVPTVWLVLDELPRNTAGKVDRDELRSRLA